MSKEIGLIIPLYNSHKTIKRLLHSISMFTFLEEIQICMIDDCDQRDYNYIVDIFSDLDITLIKREKNGGPGAARNDGIRWAIETGKKYILFADGDDYFINNNFWNEISPEEKEEYELISFDFIDEKNNRMIVQDYDIWCFGKIYKTNTIKELNLFFPEEYSNEDVVFNFILFSKVEKILHKDYPIYFWSDTANSLTKEKDYALNSLIPLLKNLSKYYSIYEKFLTEEKKKIMIINRTLRFWYGLNQFLLQFPDMMEQKDERAKEIFKAYKVYYDTCYKPNEDKIRFEDIYKEYEYMMLSSPEDALFIWIDYYSFIRLIKKEQ